MGREMKAQCKYVLHVGTAIEVCCNYNQSKTDKNGNTTVLCSKVLSGDK